MMIHYKLELNFSRNMLQIFKVEWLGKPTIMGRPMATHLIRISKIPKRPPNDLKQTLKFIKKVTMEKRLILPWCGCDHT